MPERDNEFIRIMGRIADSNDRTAIVNNTLATTIFEKVTILIEQNKAINKYIECNDGHWLESEELHGKLFDEIHNEKDGALVEIKAIKAQMAAEIKLKLIIIRLLKWVLGALLSFLGTVLVLILGKYIK